MSNRNKSGLALVANVRLYKENKMEIHPDELARMKMLEESKATSFLPGNIKPWNGHPVPVKKLDPEATIPTKANDKHKESQTGHLLCTRTHRFQS